ncbi:hypothetical protein, partial [Fangia hongkongensis]
NKIDNITMNRAQHIQFGIQSYHALLGVNLRGLTHILYKLKKLPLSLQHIDFINKKIKLIQGIRLLSTSKYPANEIESFEREVAKLILSRQEFRQFENETSGFYDSSCLADVEISESLNGGFHQLPPSYTHKLISSNTNKNNLNISHIKNKKPLYFEENVKTHDGPIKVKLMASIELHKERFYNEHQTALLRARQLHIHESRLPDDDQCRTYRQWLLMERYETKLKGTKDTSLMIEHYHNFMSALACDVSCNINDLASLLNATEGNAIT